MKYKSSIIIGLISLLTGFIPLKSNFNYDITYTIYSDNIVEANKIKEELIVFYKQYCYSSLLVNINSKMEDCLHNFPYNANYKNHNVTIFSISNKIKMTGYLYQNSPSFINFKNYFTSLANSIPEATSINVATLSLFDQI